MQSQVEENRRFITSCTCIVCEFIEEVLCFYVDAIMFEAAVAVLKSEVCHILFVVVLFSVCLYTVCDIIFCNSPCMN